MTPNQIFPIVNMLAVAAWVLLAVLPRRRWVADVIAGIAVPALLAAVYITIIATTWAGSAGGFSSLPAVATLFGNPWLLLAGWTHYLAFDLLVGSWEVRDARDHGLPHLFVLPCLALTFLFGPAGWMLYLVLRTSRLRSLPGWVQGVSMKSRQFLLTVSLTAVAAAVYAAGVAAQSNLASLFDRYDVKADFAQTGGAPAWGGATTWVAADGKGTVIVLIRAVPYFRVFMPDGKPVKSWGETGLFNQAHSAHFAPDGSVWATDPNDHVIHKFTPDGKLVLTLGKKGVTGDDTAHDSFNRPNAVGFAPNGDVYVSDGYTNSRIVQFTGDGKFIKIIGGKKGSGPGEIQVPHGVAIDRQGRIIVADSDNKRLTIFDKNGQFLKTLAAPSRGGLVVTPDDTIYVSDVNAGAVTVFKNDQIADVIKVEGRPHGLAVDPATGDVYTSSTNFDHPNVTKASPKKPAAAK